MTWLRKSTYAKRVGVSPSTVDRRLKKHGIPTRNEKINGTTVTYVDTEVMDPLFGFDELAGKRKHKNRGQAKREATQKNTWDRKKAEEFALVNGVDAENPYLNKDAPQRAQALEDGEAMSYDQLEKQRLEEQVRKLKLDNNERERLNVNREKSNKFFFDAARVVRDALLITPARVAMLCVGKTQHEIEQILTKDFHRILDMLEKDIKKLKED